MNALETTHRVTRLVTEARAAVLHVKGQQRCNNQHALQFAVDTQLPQLIKTLTDLGFANGKRKAYRLPFDQATLDTLNEASDVVSIPAVRLLEACLLLCVPADARKAAPVTAKAPRGRKAAANPKAKGKAPKATKKAVAGRPAKKGAR